MARERRRNMKVINFFGGPGTGKSTASSGLFYRMKKNNLNCEYVTEYAKELVWEERFNIINNDQLYILARQHRYIDRLKGKVDYVVTDSPLLLSAIYAGHNEDQSAPLKDADGLRLFQALTLRLFNKYDNYNFFLLTTGFQYWMTGRIQEKSESTILDEKIFDFLVENKIRFRCIEGNDESVLERILRETT